MPSADTGKPVFVSFRTVDDLPTHWSYHVQCYKVTGNFEQNLGRALRALRKLELVVGVLLDPRGAAMEIYTDKPFGLPQRLGPFENAGRLPGETRLELQSKKVLSYKEWADAQPQWWQVWRWPLFSARSAAA